ncbi:MAG TPA: hypothetical protein VIL48_02215 [Acidimicrobiales bacterium]
MSNAPTYSTRFKLLAAGLLLVAVAAFVGAYLTFSETGEDPVLSSSGQDQYVERLIPGRNDQVLAQAPIGIDLATGWSGVLVVNGTEIPEDELDITRELGLIQFTPQEGGTVEELRAGRNCVTAIVWPLSEGRTNGSRTIQWCFEVV